MTVIPIRDLNIPALEVYTKLTRRQLRSVRDPEHALFVAESATVIGHALDAGYEPVSFLMEERQFKGPDGALAARCDVPVYTAAREVLSDLTGYELTRGVLCAMKRPDLPTVEEVCAGAKRIAVLEDIVDPTNVGAIFRSAAALGMDGVLVTPSCCDPFHRRAVRVSMGTLFQVPWTVIGDSPAQWPEKGLERLKALGFATAALALTDRSVPIGDPALAREERLALVLGTEGDGLKGATVAGCDHTVRIPMAHGVDSLNVNAAAAVAFWELRLR